MQLVFVYCLFQSGVVYNYYVFAVPGQVQCCLPRKGWYQGAKLEDEDRNLWLYRNYEQMYCIKQNWGKLLYFGDGWQKNEAHWLSVNCVLPLGGGATGGGVLCHWRGWETHKGLRWTEHPPPNISGANSPEGHHDTESQAESKVFCCNLDRKIINKIWTIIKQRKTCFQND